MLKDTLTSKKRLSIIILPLLAVTGALAVYTPQSPAQPQVSPAPTKAAVVDLSKIFNEYEKSQKFENELLKTRNEIKARLKRMQDKIESLQAELQNFNPESQDYFKRQKELLRLQIDYKVEQRVRLTETEREMRMATKDIYDEILDTIADIAAQEGYSLVFQKDEVDLRGAEKLSELRQGIMSRKVLYAADSVDITQLVLETLNQQYRLDQAAGK